MDPSVSAFPGAVAVLDDGSAGLRELSQSLGVPLLDEAVSRQQELPDFLLCRGSRGALSLLETESRIAISAGFDSGATGYRLRQPLGAELLIKAVGGLRAKGQSVIDATAGLGRDALLLASAGFHVTMLERSDVVIALLEDALVRARDSDDGQLLQALSRMSLHRVDAVDWLAKHRADVVVLDPMFPPRRKSARVKKEMYLLGHLLGAAADSDDGGSLLEPALHSALKRVVVKRPKSAPFLAGRRPDWQLHGKSGRFDVYAVPD